MLSKSKLTALVLLATCLSISLACSTESGTAEASDQGGNTDITYTGDSGIYSAGNTEKNAEQLEAVLALEGDPEYGAYLAGDCLTCHTLTQTNGTIPQIHGKDKSFLASALLEYKNKQRASEVMRGVATALSNEEMAALITYLSEQ